MPIVRLQRCEVCEEPCSWALVQADTPWSTPRLQHPWLTTDLLQCINWAGQAAHQLTVDLARRAHQSPGRLVDEDGLRGLPFAQRTGQGQSSVVAFLVWELVRLQEPLHRRGKRTACVLPVKSVTGLFVTLCRQDCESRWRHTSIDRYIRIARTLACTRTVYTSGEQGRELQFAASIHPS